jgi:hypothetical protein
VENMVDIYEYLRYTINLISQTEYKDIFILKGGSVLVSKMIEANRLDLYRITTDIDIHCNSKEIWINFSNNVETILNNNDRGYVYKLIKRRSDTKGLNTSDSLAFELNDKGNIIKFKMDMNIKSNSIITIEYSPLLNMSTYDAYTMLSDKIVTISSQFIYRRIKDLYDLSVLSSLYNFQYSEVIKYLSIKHPDVNLVNMMNTVNYEALEHAYSKYTGITNKPDFRVLLTICTSFMYPIYNGYKGELIWNTNTQTWVNP